MLACVHMPGQRTPKGDLAEILRMLMHIADENAREWRKPQAPLVTEAILEEREWNAFKTGVKRGRLVLAFDLDTYDNIEEEDIDLLLAVVTVLERAHEHRQALTLAEIVRELQRDGVLAVEFIAAARGQALRLLSMLVGAGRVLSDSRGSYRLNRD